MYKLIPLVTMSDSGIYFVMIRSNPKIDIDYTPAWGRGSPNTYIDNLTFPKVLDDRPYRYRVVKGNSDLGTRDADAVGEDDSQRLNFLECNKGYGIADSNSIKVYAVDPDSGNQYLVTQWK